MNKGYINYLIANKKSDNTIKNYTKHIQSALDFIGKEEKDITYSDLINWQASISNLSSATIALEINSIRSYFKYLTAVGEININPTTELVAPKIKNKVKPYCTTEDIRSMLNNTRSYRDRAVIALIASTGLRMSEMAQITMDQWNEMVHFNSRNLIILGKGNKERTIYVNDMAMEAIKDYLNHRKNDSDYLFASNCGNILDDSNLNKMIKNVAKKANLSFWEDMSCHALRAAFATIANDKGVPVAVISAALGHESLTTTTKYIKTCQTQINNAMSSMVF